MNKMKYQILSPLRSAICLVLLSTVIFSSCTKKQFEERNIDPTRLDVLNSDDAKALFGTALYAGMNTGPGTIDYQQSQNLFADMFCQYFGGTQTAFASHRYVINQSWVQYQWNSTYLTAMPALKGIIDQTATDPDRLALNAIARIWKIYVFHRTTDYFGPIPYSQIGKDSTVIYYDAQKDIYDSFFKELDQAISDLHSSVSQPSYGSSDVMFGGNNQKWLAFANTLKLRLAMRTSYVDPTRAKTEAEAAVADGVMTDISQDGYMSVSSPNNYNGLARISAWNEMRMSTSMESLLKGYNDPRLSKYFQPAVSTGLYTGVRNGMVPAEQVLPANDYDQASNLVGALTPDSMFITPIKVMNSAEAYFLRAEGALNGWNMGGAAGDLYNSGITMALKTWNITNATTINNYINGTSLPIAPGGYFHTPALTDIPVKFSSDPSKQLEQIMTQKWLAIFPDGFEAWAEMRRTGFPKMYPLIHSENPDVPANVMIRRIPFLDLEKATNGPAVTAALPLLGGPDNAATHLWWDVKP
jgi:hypothetical protein